MKIIRAKWQLYAAIRQIFMDAKDQYMAFVSNKDVITEIGTKKTMSYLS